MDIKLVHVTEFHCELNSIEMQWANLNYYFKKHNVQITSEDVITKRILEASKKAYGKFSNFEFFLFFLNSLKSHL